MTSFPCGCAVWKVDDSIYWEVCSYDCELFLTAIIRKKSS